MARTPRRWSTGIQSASPRYTYDDPRRAPKEFVAGDDRDPVVIEAESYSQTEKRVKTLDRRDQRALLRRVVLGRRFERPRTGRERTRDVCYRRGRRGSARRRKP